MPGCGRNLNSEPETRNPEPARGWEYTRSTQLVLQALGPRMFPLTLDGVARGIDALRK